MLFTKEGVSALHAWTHKHVHVLTPSQFTQPIPGFGQPSVRDQLAHILETCSADRARLQRCRLVIPSRPQPRSGAASRGEESAVH